ncbi:MAG: hypothetical protein A2V70_08395 [Planctomycetes bacterium RBG_13_63_9]|nr:MAG: hypothetical protein A2V70_08395 [Planctomycetes bacterium RBG_13_63_9]
MRCRLPFNPTPFAGVLALVVLCLPPTMMAQDAGAPTDGASGAQSRTVHQQVDGYVAGRVSIHNPSGNLEPARVKLSFVQNGNVIASVRSDEWGRFQANGLKPGVYSVIATGEQGLAILAVTIHPFQENLAEEQSLLDVILVPTADFDLLAKMMAEEVAGPGAAPSAGFAVGAGGGGGGRGGGGFGGGGGLGAMLGAGGLAAGLAALGSEDKTTTTEATPSTP